MCVWCARVTRGVCEADTVIPDARARPLRSPPPATLWSRTPGVSSEAWERQSRAEASAHAAGSEPPKEPGLQRAPKLSPAGASGGPCPEGVSPWACAPSPEQPGTKAGAPFLGPCPGPSFTSSKAKERGGCLAPGSTRR